MVEVSAFLNSLWEEGTLPEIRQWIERIAKEKNLTYTIPEPWTRKELHRELSRLYYEQVTPSNS